MVAQLGATPRRRLYRGPNLERAVAIADLRARSHRRLPRIALEYLEGGAGEEATLARERAAYAEWRFIPRTLVDESRRDTASAIFGREAAMPLIIAPTGLNGLFQRHADIALARAAANARIPFVQSTMSNDRMEAVAQVPGLRHWWQLYVFRPDEIWQTLVDRAAAAGCEALVLTTNAQLFGRREWDQRLRLDRSMPSIPAIVDAACHPGWIARTLSRGMPCFSNVLDFVPKDRRGFFDSAFWIREQMPRSLSWPMVRRIRDRWKGPFLLKGLLHPDDVRLARDSGVDGVILGAHGGRQADWSVSALDMLPRARAVAGDRIALFMSGGIRRGTDILKALALGADAVLSGRAILYGLGAAGQGGAQRAIAILKEETDNALDQIGAPSLRALGPDWLIRARDLPLMP